MIKSNCLKADYLKNGFAVVRQAISSRICEKLIQETEKMKKKSGFLSSFIDDKTQKTHENSNFYVDKLNKVSYFF